MSIRVITFATDEYAASASVLRDTAIAVGGADSVKIYEPKDVAALGLSPTAPGFGWWRWKPWIIAKELDVLPDGDLLVYCDAGMAFDASIAPYQRVAEKTPNGILLFDVGEIDKDHRILSWTSPRALAKLRVADPSARMVNAAVQLYVSGVEARNFVRRYLHLCSDPDILTDPPHDQLGPALAHRHDQSVLSVLARNDDIKTAADPTQYGQHDPGRLVDASLLDHHRRKINRMVKVCVITATAGGPHLAECIESVQKQTLPNIEHWIVVDGPEASAKVNAVVAKFRDKRPIVVAELPRKVGGNGWNAHRVNGSFPYLVDADYVAFLDDDNAYEPEHLADLVREIRNSDAAWGHSLRMIVSPDGKPVCPDNCESLGGIFHTVLGRGDYLIDTSCYVLHRDVAIHTAPAWNARARDPEREEVDRALAKALLSQFPHAVVRKHSVRYRVSSRPDSVSADFFLGGNSVRGYDFANKRDLYVFHFSDAATENVFVANDRALGEWQPGMYDELRRDYNILNGFAVAPNIPHGSTCLIAMCDSRALPLDLFERRKDLRKIVYTVESPNIRHADQFKASFLTRYFDVALTYWEPLLVNPPPGLRTEFCPHNCHQMTFPRDTAVFRSNSGSGRSVVMVLGYRPELSGSYTIDGTRITCLDPLRGQLVSKLRQCTVVGVGWDTYPDVPGLTKVVGGKTKDERHAVDWYERHTFALIVENCDAEGYVSEKLYDALTAGAIPLYWGSPSRRLLAHIPELNEVVIDIRNMSSEQVQDVIDALSDDDIASIRAKIVELRRGILTKVGASDFAQRVKSV